MMGKSNESSVLGMGMKEDRISDLPDCLLLEILSRLPSTKTTITTATLSKRWTNLWTSLPTLAFYDHLSPSDFVSYVNQTLTHRRPLKLRKFELFTGYDILFAARINDWIRYAISRDVEELKLSFYQYHSGGVFHLNGYFFVNSSFTDLRLHGCIFNPTGMISWKRLRTLWISWGTLDEYLIENILSGSPVLETLVLESCRGYRRLNITSKSVKKLVVCGYCPDDVSDDLMDIVEINAPHISSLKILGKLLLWKLVLLNVSTLLEAFLNYTKFGYKEHTFKEAEEEMLKGFIQSLRHVNVLKIGRICAKVIDRLEAKGFNVPSNVKLLDVTSLV